MGDTVADGFYESMTSLKTCDIDSLQFEPNLADQFSNYKNILKLCEDHYKIPPMSRDRAAKLLARLKKDIKDFYSITA